MCDLSIGYANSLERRLKSLLSLSYEYSYKFISNLFSISEIIREDLSYFEHKLKAGSLCQASRNVANPFLLLQDFSFGHGVQIGGE